MRIPYDYIRVLAMASDEKFAELVAGVGYTQKPDPQGESIEDFRLRVIVSLERQS